MLAQGLFAQSEAEIAALLTALHIDSANVIGWSDGGIERLLHSTPLVYADEFNQKVDTFFQSPYRVIAGEGRFF